MEKARKSSEARLEAARALPAAYLQEVFESEKAKVWPILKVGDVSQISGGIQKTPARAPVKNFRPYLTVRNVQRGYLDLSQVDQFEITESELERYRLEDKDILIVEGNGSPSHIGRNALFVTDGQEWIHQNHIIRVRIDQNTCLPEFASAYLNSQGGKAQMLEKAETTSGLYTLSTSKVGALELPVPPLSVQKRSIQDIYKHRKEITKMGDSIAEEKMAFDSLPVSLLRQAFSGVLINATQQEKISTNGKSLNSQKSVNDAVKSICDIMRRRNVTSAVQYVPELTWILFLRVLDERTRRLEEAEAVGRSSTLTRVTLSLARLGGSRWLEADRAGRGRWGPSSISSTRN